MRKKVAIFCGGPSSEYEVSLSSASTIYKHINKKKYELYFFYISKTGTYKLLLASEKVDLNKINTQTPLIHGLEDLKKRKIFALLAGTHGEFVEDGRLQGLLEHFDIPYSGSGVTASSLAMDKYRSSLLANNIPGVNLPKTALLKDDSKFPDELKFPVIVKPNAMGSSVGVTIARNLKDYNKQISDFRKKYPLREIIIQEYLENAIEIQSGVLQKKNGEFLNIPPIEIIPKINEFFDYDSKYKIGGATEITPPIGISKKLADKIARISIDLHKLLGLKTYSRNDFLTAKGKVYFLEANTLPGMTATSLLPQEVKAIGMSYPKLLDFLISNS